MNKTIPVYKNPPPDQEGKFFAIAMIIGILFLILTSCSSERRIARKQAKWCNNVIKVDSIVTIQSDTVIRESISVIKLAPNPDTLRLFAQAYCDSSNNAQLPSITILDNGHKAQISVVDNELKAEIICNMDSLEQIIKEKSKSIKYLKEHKEVKTLLRYKKVGRFYIWYFWISIGVFVISIAARILWRYFKL